MSSGFIRKSKAPIFIASIAWSGRRVPRDEQHRHARVELPKLAIRVEAGLVGQVDVEDDGIGPMLREQLEALRGGRGRDEPRLGLAKTRRKACRIEGSSSMIRSVGVAMPHSRRAAHRRLSLRERAPFLGAKGDDVPLPLFL